MTKILAVDASTEACSAALYVDGKVMSDKTVAPQGHTKLLLPMIDKLLNNANLKLTDLDAISTGRGPGSFTGVRIGVSLAQGLAFGAGVPLIGIGDLEVIAYQAMKNTTASFFVSAIDARMGEVYLGIYQKNSKSELEPLCDEQVISPEAALELIHKYIGNQEASYAGTGFEKYPELSEGSSMVKAPEDLPWAESVATLAAAKFKRGELSNPEEVLPVYLRDQVTWKKVDEQKKKKQSKK